jgi:hypothetical protein
MLDAVGPGGRAHKDVHVLLVFRETRRPILLPFFEPRDGFGARGIRSRKNLYKEGEDLVLGGLGEPLPGDAGYGFVAFIAPAPSRGWSGKKQSENGRNESTAARFTHKGTAFP